MRRCTAPGCTALLPYDSGQVAKRRKDGTPIFRARCKACLSAQRKAWRLKNVERDRANVNRWQRAEYAKNGEWAGKRRAQRREEHTGSPAYKRDHMDGRVDAGPVRDAIVASGLGSSLIARRAGFSEETPVRRAMKSERVSVQTAERILEALGVAPVEVGL